MSAERTTDEYGQAIITRTVQNGFTVKATVTNEFVGLPMEGAGIVDVMNADYTMLRFTHTMAEGAAEELTLAFRKVWIDGQESGGRVAIA